MEKEELNLYDIIISLKSAWKFLLSKWIIVSVFGVTGGILGLTYAFMDKPVYKAKLSFVIEDSTKPGTNITSMLGIGGSSPEIFNTMNIMDFMKMRSLVEKALLKPIPSNTKITFAEQYLKDNGKRENWKDNKKLSKIKFLPNEERSTFSREKDSILGEIFSGLVKKEELVIERPNEENMIVAIRVKSKGPKFSRFFPEALLNVVSDFYIETKTKKITTNLIATQKLVDSVRRELYSDISSVASGLDNVFGLNPTKQIAKSSVTIRDANASTNKMILAEMIKSLESTKLDLLKQTPTIQIVDEPIEPLSFDKVGKTIGGLLGGFLGGFIICSFLLFKRYIHKLKEINENKSQSNELVVGK